MGWGCKEDRKQREGDQGGGERVRPGGREAGDGSWTRGVKRMEGV